METIVAMFCIFAILLLLGMVGDRNAENRKNYASGFCVLVIAITVLALKLCK